MTLKCVNLPFYLLANDSGAQEGNKQGQEHPLITERN